MHIALFGGEDKQSKSPMNKCVDIFFSFMHEGVGFVFRKGYPLGVSIFCFKNNACFEDSDKNLRNLSQFDLQERERYQTPHQYHHYNTEINNNILKYKQKFSF